VEHSSSRRIATSLIALALGNLALDGGLGCLLRSNDMRWAIFLVANLLIVVGLQLGQTMLLAFWISFSDERWYWRCAVPALVSASLVAACALCAGSGLGDSILGALAVQGLLWILVAFLVPLRRLRSWRLKRGGNSLPAEQKQYGIRDLLIWMAVIAVPLAIVRFLISLSTANTVSAGLRGILLLGLMLLPLLWLAILAALVPRGRRYSWTFAGGILAYAVIAVAVGAREFYNLVLAPFWLPRPGWVLLLLSMAIVSAIFITSTSVLWLNCLCIRRAGWQLVRPADRQLAPQ